MDENRVRAMMDFIRYCMTVRVGLSLLIGCGVGTYLAYNEAAPLLVFIATYGATKLAMLVISD